MYGGFRISQCRGTVKACHLNRQPRIQTMAAPAKREVATAAKSVHVPAIWNPELPSFIFR
jgi:hypothetical protein